MSKKLTRYEVDVLRTVIKSGRQISIDEDIIFRSGLDKLRRYTSVEDFPLLYVQCAKFMQDYPDKYESIINDYIESSFEFEICENCRFWAEVYAPLNPDRIGQCRSHKPMVGDTNNFPYTNKDTWCGEWN